ncbi:MULTISPECIES: integrase [Streptomyces]|uniref:integrase n=1 Tax=Streptomyces TaxID=1883 RepID=UPI002ECFB2E1|nr:integrase [Streptomyces sp. NBC_00826]WTH94201.1 integrase [Streptomyces sp. NBC_00825]WTI02936.1 integrase [Streptomyces sp. NBC_00822]
MPYTEWRGESCRVRWKTGRRKPNGKPEYDSQGGFTDEEAAYDYGLDRESDVRNARYISRRDGNILMSAYCPTWLKTQDVGHLRWRQLDGMLRNHIVPYWGEQTLGDIKASDYRTWTLYLKDQPNIGDAYGREILLAFSMIMDDAVDDGLRSDSPVKKRSRRGKYTKKPREKKRDMLMDDVHRLALNGLTFWGFPGYVFYLTKPFTCMRPGELYALRREYCHPNWPASDPDPDRRKEAMERYGPVDLPALRVEWQFQREFGKGPVKLFPPKYGSHRNIVLPRFLAELHQALLATHDHEYLFPAIGGGLLANANFSYHYWRPVADGRSASEEFTRVRLNQPQTVTSRRPLPEIPATPYAGKRLYLLRHGGKEWLDEDGHSRIAVETRMGHEVAGVEGLYAHVTVPMEQQIANSLQRRWLRFVARAGEGFALPSPRPLPFDLQEWWNQQVKAARDLDLQSGS